MAPPCPGSLTLYRDMVKLNTGGGDAPHLKIKHLHARRQGAGRMGCRVGVFAPFMLQGFPEHLLWVRQH